MVGTHAGDMIGEIALAIEMGADTVDIGKTIHPHPTLGESIGMAAEVAHGSCTDVPPAQVSVAIRSQDLFKTKAAFGLPFLLMAACAELASAGGILFLFLSCLLSFNALIGNHDVHGKNFRCCTVSLCWHRSTTWLATASPS
jgi:hypothetical protein